MLLLIDGFVCGWLQDDFYLNLVDWSSQNMLAVGLGSSVYLWSAQNSKVTRLVDVGPDDLITSVAWTVRVGAVLLLTMAMVDDDDDDDDGDDDGDAGDDDDDVDVDGDDVNDDGDDVDDVDDDDDGAGHTS